MSEGSSGGGQRGETLLYLTDEQLRKGIEAMFFAYKGFTSDPDRILEERGYGRAHHRAIHFIHRSHGTTVNNLLAILILMIALGALTVVGVRAMVGQAARYLSGFAAVFVMAIPSISSSRAILA